MFFVTNCSILMKTVEETGVIIREIRDLEDQASFVVLPSACNSNIKQNYQNIWVAVEDDSSTNKFLVLIGV